MSLAGNLRTVSFPDILQLLATGKKSGILELKTETRQKEVAFKAGNIVYASSLNTSEDLLGNMLLNRGKISKTDLDKAIAMHKQTGRQLGTTLIDMNLFDKQEIAECLRLQIEEIVYNLFSWQKGEFCFHESREPKNAPFLLDLNTMNVLMEGTRRIDEWVEIQKVLPPDDRLLAVCKLPKFKSGEVVLTTDEFRILAMINGERTLSDILTLTPIGEFVSCRALYKLILNGLIEATATRSEQEEPIDEEEVVLSIVFHLYNNCFYRIRNVVQTVTGADNTRFLEFGSQFRNGLLNYFPGVDPKSDAMPPFDRFLDSVRALPAEVRYHQLLRGLESMLTEQLEFVYQFLGAGIFHEASCQVRKEISQPLMMNRELVKRYGLEDGFYKTIKKADRVVKLVRG